MGKGYSLLLVGVLLSVSCGEDEPSSPPPPVAVLSASPAWGDAPLETALSWRFDAGYDGDLACALDLDGDGQTDETVSPCPSTGSRSVSFSQPGEHNPSLLVSRDGDPVAHAAVRVFSNALVLADEVVSLDDLEELSRTDAGAGGVDFELGSGGNVEVGTIIMSSEGGGLLVRVTSVSPIAGGIAVETTPATLDEAISDGFFGVIADTPDGLVQVSAPPLKGDLIKGDWELATEVETFSESIPLLHPIAGAEVSGSAQAGLKAFVLKKTLFSPLEYEVKVWAAAAVKIRAELSAGMESGLSYALPEIFLGIITIPTPIPIIITCDLEPTLFAEVSLQAGVEAELDGHVWVMGGAGNLSGELETFGDLDFDASFTVGPVEDAYASGDAKAGITVRLKTQLLSVVGPFAEAGAYARGRMELSADSFCVESWLGVEGAVGGELEIWVIDAEFKHDFEPSEWELSNDCLDFGCTPTCQGKACGPDGCGGSCGGCGAGLSCTDAGACACMPSCDGVACGEDGCGGPCCDGISGLVCVLPGECASPGGPPLIATASIAPDSGPKGTLILTEATVADPDGPADILSVQLVVREKPTDQGPMMDDGGGAAGSGDKVAGDGVYSMQGLIEDAPGVYHLDITATDTKGQQAQTTVTFEITP
jgi:hypothetical protein